MAKRKKKVMGNSQTAAARRGPTLAEIQAKEPTSRRSFLKKMFSTNWVIAIIALGAAVMLGLTIYMRYNTRTEPIEMTPGDIVTEYYNNELMAYITYEDQPMIVSGIVYSKDVEDIGAGKTYPCLTVQDATRDSADMRVDCYFTSEDRASAMWALGEGESVRVQGTFLGVSTFPMMADCKVIG